MTTEEIEWGYNCLTGGPHHGRPEKIWNIPLIQAATVMFRAEQLKQLVIARIYNDAMQMVEHGAQHLSQEWANKVKEYAVARYANVLQHSVGEITTYYNSAGWQLEQQGIVLRVQEDRLNPRYEPQHPHDSINLLCRMVGVHAASQATAWEIARAADLEARS